MDYMCGIRCALGSLWVYSGISVGGLSHRFFQMCCIIRYLSRLPAHYPMLRIIIMKGSSYHIKQRLQLSFQETKLDQVKAEEIV
jgi:hypothetical protein